MGCQRKPVAAVLHGRKASTRGRFEGEVKLLIGVYSGDGNGWVGDEYTTCQWCPRVLLAFGKETVQHPGPKHPPSCWKGAGLFCSRVTRGGQRPSLGVDPSTGSPTAAVGDSLGRQKQRGPLSLPGLTVPALGQLSGS